MIARYEVSQFRVDIRAGTVTRLTRGQQMMLEQWSMLAPSQRAALTGLLELYGQQRKKPELSAAHEPPPIIE